MKNIASIRSNFTCCSALVPSCAQTGQHNGDVQAEKHIYPPTPHVALKTETLHTLNQISQLYQ